MYRIESLLSARLFLTPQVVGDQLFFISNLNGRNNLYRMKLGGSVPQPLLPGNIALQNPHLIEGRSFIVFPDLGKIMVLIDQDGDENYQPAIISIDGGYPEFPFRETFPNHSVMAVGEKLAQNTVYFIAQSRSESLFTSYLADMSTGELEKISEGTYGMFPMGINESNDQFILAEQFGMGDPVLYHASRADKTPRHFYGVTLAQRQAGQKVEPTAVSNLHFTANGQGLIFSSILFDDSYSLAYMPFADPEHVTPIHLKGVRHSGVGEMETVEHLTGSRYSLQFNIDGCTWLYEGELDETTWTMSLVHLLCGEGELSNGVLESVTYDAAGDRFALSFSTSTSPTQLYTIEGAARDQIRRHTNEQVLGIAPDLLSAGEDASFVSYDGLRISARLYLPAAELGYEGQRPLIYYVHGGPQGQERPDFAWFSMPFIQFLTLNGFAVFVPNVRGSTGYGFAYMKRVERDWGGQDRLDHVHAMTQVLPQDPRLDVSRAGVVGRSYGGYMTLTLASRHPELWSAAVDMFGPYDLSQFAGRVPETWKPFMKMLVGDPETEQEFLQERSPRTYIHQIECPLLVVQGQNDPRVIEQESRELVEELRGLGKTVDYLLFADEGHDVLKFENRVTVYNRMTAFFQEQLS
ncbi:MAG: S9 family peptidase [Chloroflexi bacterium]|nr:S9 family peptidase [Chloroflexota bacterium]